MIEGSIVALITPFDSENNVDYEEIKRLCKYHLDNNTDGLCILGTTAEAESLSDSEKGVNCQTGLFVDAPEQYCRIAVWIDISC